MDAEFGQNLGTVPSAFGGAAPNSLGGERFDFVVCPADLEPLGNGVESGVYVVLHPRRICSSRRVSMSLSSVDFVSGVEAMWQGYLPRSSCPRRRAAGFTSVVVYDHSTGGARLPCPLDAAACLSQSVTVVGELDLEGKFFARVAARVVYPLAPDGECAQRFQVGRVEPPALLQRGHASG